MLIFAFIYFPSRNQEGFYLDMVIMAGVEGRVFKRPKACTSVAARARSIVRLCMARPLI
jgi:hypothetical protein